MPPAANWVLVGTNPPRDWQDRGPEKVLTDFLHNNWDLTDPDLALSKVRWNELYSANNDLFIKILRGPSDGSPLTLGWGDFNENYNMQIIVAARSLVDTYPEKNSEYFLDRIEDYIKRQVGQDPDALESEGILLMHFLRTDAVEVKGSLADSNITDVRARLMTVRCYAIHTIIP